MNFSKLLQVLMLLMPLSASAGGAAPAQAVEKAATDVLSAAFEEWRKAPLIEAEVSKKVVSPWLAQPRSASGMIYVSKQKLRLEMKQPEKSLMVLNGDDLWMEVSSGDLGSGIQVSHFKTSGARKSNALLALLFGESKIGEELSLVKEESSGDRRSYLMKPKNPKRFEATEVTIETDKKGKTLKSISYKDEVENVTTYEFSNVSVKEKSQKDLFHYKPPKDAEVTRF